MFRFIAIVLAVLAVHAGLAVCPPSAVAADAGRNSPPPAFRTESDFSPGDWVRFDVTFEGLGPALRQSFLLEVLSNDGRELAIRMIGTNLDTGEKEQNTITDDDTTGTVESNLLAELSKDSDGTARSAAPVRETITMAGRAFDCVVISAAASPGTGLNSGVFTEARVWYSPEVPEFGMVKKEKFTWLMHEGQVKQSMTERVELTEWGDASRPPKR